MTRPIKDLIVAIIIGLYLAYGATAGMMAGVEIQKLQEELTALQYEVGVMSASNNPK